MVVSLSRRGRRSAVHLRSGAWRSRGCPGEMERAGSLQPLAGGGVRFAVDREVEGLLNVGGVYLPREPKAVAPEKAELIECVKEDDSVIARWRLQRGTQSAEATYTFRLWGKSLVVDVHCNGGEVGEIHAGGFRER
jgi:hypothetical protein